LAAVLLIASALAFASPAAAKTRPRQVTLEWVGDMAMSTQLGLPPGGVANALAPVSKDLHGANVTFGNLEGTLSVGGTSKCATLGGDECFAFQAPPSTAFGLRRLGFRLVNQANNHSLDYGYSGRAQTVVALNAAGVEHTGFPGEITYLRAAHMRLAFVGFAPYPYDANLLDIPAARAMIHRAAKHAQIVVVIIHAGAEGADQTHTPYGEQYYLGEDRGNARAFAHAAIQAGASIVVGSGPHVIRGVEDYRGRMIAYSLGNFIGYHTLGGGGVLSESAILRVTLDPRGRVLAARWIPIVLENGLPRPDPSDASAHLVAALSREDFHRYWRVDGNGTFVIPGKKKRHRRHSVARVAATPGLSVTGYQQESDPTSAITASEHALSTVGIDGVHLSGRGTTVDQPDAGALRQLAVAHHDHLKAILLVGNWYDPINNFSERIAHDLLGDPAAIGSVAQTLAMDARREGWNGISIDLESLRPRDTNGLTAFATALRADLPAADTLAIDVSNYTSAGGYRANGYDLAALGNAVTVFVLMAYDDHGPWENTPGPIGPLAWQRAGLAVVLRSVPASKVDLGVAGYGYAWRPHRNLRLSVAQARELARQGGGTPRWVARVGEWTARLRDGSALWWSDVRSYRLRVALARADHLHGIAVWALGQDDPL
jgi:spore germination protein YaaH